MPLKNRKRKNPALVSSQSLLEVAQNFLKSEEETRLAAEADKEAAKEEEEHVTQQKEEQEEHEEKNEIASSEDNVSPKAIEFAKAIVTERGEES